MKKLLFIISLCTLCLFTAGLACAEKINVVVSIYPLKDIVQQVGGDRVKVDFIVPPGASPHTFEPTPSDMIKIHSARLFVIIGAGLEFWADKAIRAAGGKDLTIISLSNGIHLIPEVPSHGGKEGHHTHGAADPHIWLDPLLMKDMAQKIADTLCVLDSAGRAYYAEKAEAFKKELDRLHLELSEKTSRFRTKEYITFHPAWNYFSRRYGLRVAEVIEESPGKEASPRHIAKIIKEIKRIGTKVIFAEPQFNPRIAEIIAKEAGARVLLLDPIGSPEQRSSYLALIRYNLSIMKEAMQ